MKDAITLIIIILLSFVAGWCISGTIHRIQMQKLLDDVFTEEAYAYSRGFSDGYKLGRENTNTTEEQK